MDSIFWNAITALSTTIGTIAILIASVLAIRQLREATRLRYFEVLQSIFDDFHEDQALRDRLLIYSMRSPTHTDCTSEERNQIERVIERYQRIAYLCRRGFIPSEMILEMYLGSFISVWRKLERYISGRKGKRFITGLTNYAVDFEAFVKEALLFRQKRLGEKGGRYLLE